MTGADALLIRRQKHSRRGGSGNKRTASRREWIQKKKEKQRLQVSALADTMSRLVPGSGIAMVRRMKGREGEKELP